MEDMSSGFVRCIELLYESVEALRRDVADLRVGVNVQDLNRFREFTPMVHFTASGEQAYWPRRSREPGDDEYRSCTDFVISNALRLQVSIRVQEPNSQQRFGGQGHCQIPASPRWSARVRVGQVATTRQGHRQKLWRPSA
jgi:hypothetical protein